MFVEIIKFDTRAPLDAGTLRVSWEICDCNLISAAGGHRHSHIFVCIMEKLCEFDII